MATYTSNYGWTKPSGSDNVDISVLNDNLDDQDSTIHDAFLNMAPPFSESSTYAVDDIVLYGTGLYKCHTAVVTPGSWTGSTNWQVYKLSEGGSGGGGTSNYNQLTNKPQINSVELSGNKTSAQLGLMASDGVVANPTGQTTGSLTALEVGGTKYAVPSGGTSDYTALTNKPSINGVTLSGNKTTSDLGISYNDLTNKPSLATVATSGSYVDLSSKPQVNGVELSGNKTASQLGMANSNTFQGTIAEWNQLTTAEKKAYDHTSLTGVGGGEYNVYKTTGDLVPTSGMPSEYPATQVMMSDGVTSVANAIDNVYTATNGTGVSGAFHYTKIGRIVVGAGLMTMTQNLSEYSDIVTELPRPETITMGAFEANESGYNRVFVNDRNGMGTITTRIARNSGDSIRLSCVYLSAH